ASVSSTGSRAIVAGKETDRANAKNDGAGVISVARSRAPDASDWWNASNCWGLEKPCERYGELYGERDPTPRDRRGQARGHVRALALMGPNERRLKVAKIRGEKRAAEGLRGLSSRLNGFASRRASELKQRLSDEMHSIDKQLVANRTSYVNGGCTDGVGSAVAVQKDLMARRKIARAVAELHPWDMAREFAKRNRARRSALLVARRRRRSCGANESIAIKKEVIEIDRSTAVTNGGVGAPPPDGVGLEDSDEDKDEAGEEEVRARREDARALAWVDSREVEE
ncbi:unnamed protein product, partial [Laminaria digitata]